MPSRGNMFDRLRNLFRARPVVSTDLPSKLAGLLERDLARLDKAKSGLDAGRPAPSWDATCSRLADAGLGGLARTLGGASASPSSLLRSAFVLGLYWQAG